MIRGLVFDIDDTLFDEREYARSGFRYVANQVATSPAEADRLFAFLWTSFEAGVRGDSFDRLLRAVPELADRTTTAVLVGMYRAHRPAIALSLGWAGVLDELSERGLRLGILSDGPAQSQLAKADVLGLSRWFDPIVVTGALDAGYAKPGTAGFESIGLEWALAPSELAYVADNPMKDFIGPRKLGWATIRMRRPGQLRSTVEPAGDAAAPDLEIRAPTELIAWLDHPAARRDDR